MACRILKVSTSGFYEWRRRPASDRDREDAQLANTISAIHAASRQTYGVRRVHAELRYGHGVAISHKRVWRCMKLVGLQGVHRRRWRRPRPAAASWPDLVNRQFRADGPDRLWVTDITQHRTPWILTVVATRAVYPCSSKAARRSVGVSQPIVLRGRVLSCSATALRSATLCCDRSVPFGKY